MSDTEGEKAVNYLNFKWGVKKGVGGKKKNIQFYESFTYEGVEYSLYDSVILYQRGDLETYVGKLVQIYETPSQEKKVKIVWFFCPFEIQNFLNDYKPDVNELFLASGKGLGLFNINPLEFITRKCNVLCASNDRRNPQASEEDLNKADHVFYRTFDVAKRKIRENFPSEIAGVKVENFFNRKKCRTLENKPDVKEDFREFTGKSSPSSRLGLDVVVGNAVKGGNSGIHLSPVVKESTSATNGDKQGYHRSGNIALRPTTSIAKSRKEKISAEKSVKAKESRTDVVKVDKQWCFPCYSTTLMPKSSDSKYTAGESYVERKDRLKGERTGKLGSSRLVLDKAVGGAVKFGTSGNKEGSVVKVLGKEAVNVDKPRHFQSNDTSWKPKTSVDMGGIRPGSCSQVKNRAQGRHYENITPPSASDVPFKKRKILQDDSASEDFDKFVQNKGTKTDSVNLDAARTSNSDRRSWFKQLPFKEKLQRAHELGTLVSLENLDPSCTSSEVEDLVWQAFPERVEAKMLQQNTFSSPHNGKALVIFKSRDAADMAILELRRICLMLADGRPVIGSRATFSEPGKPTRFTGHLIINKTWQKQWENTKKAVSTSHCSQPNTLEYDMVVQCCMLQKQSDEWWKALYEFTEHLLGFYLRRHCLETRERHTRLDEPAEDESQ